MNTAEKLVEVAENASKVHEAGKEWAYENPKTPTDGRTWMCEWYAGLNAVKGYIWDDYYDEEGMQEPLNDESTYLESIEYPRGTHYVTNFNTALTTRAWKEMPFTYENVPVPTKKFTGILDMTSAETARYAFGYETSFVTDAGTIIFSERECDYTGIFRNLGRLKKLNARGKIKSIINFQHSPLDKESITSIVNALDSEVTGQTCTFNKTAIEAEFTEEEWAELAGTKTNWEIQLS